MKQHTDINTNSRRVSNTDDDKPDVGKPNEISQRSPATTTTTTTTTTATATATTTNATSVDGYLGPTRSLQNSHSLAFSTKVMLESVSLTQVFRQYKYERHYSMNCVSTSKHNYK